MVPPHSIRLREARNLLSMLCVTQPVILLKRVMLSGPLSGKGAENELLTLYTHGCFSWLAQDPVVYEETSPIPCRNSK